MWTNYHSHTCFSDGSDEPEAYIKQAIEKGLMAYGFSCHAPLPIDLHWCMKKEHLPEYCSVIDALKREYANQLEIYCGLEIDHVPELLPPYDFMSGWPEIDYCVGSVHYVDTFADGKGWNIDSTPEEFALGLQEIWEGNIRMAITRYYELVREMVKLSKPTIIGHMDKIRMYNEDERYFNEGEGWYQDELMHTLEVVSQSNCIMEINTRGMYKGTHQEPYPSAWIIRQAKKFGIPVTLSSDCHRPEQVSNGFETAAAILADCGYEHVNILLQGTWQEAKFDPGGIKKQ
jgi:histidinol-phosphatase (PHP family)